MVLDKSPTLGEPNDTCGILGTISGIVYDNLGAPLSNTGFQLIYRFTTDENGRFTTKVFATINQQNHLEYWSNGALKSIQIQPVSYSLKPVSTIQIDIHLIDDLTSIKTIEDEKNNPVKLYPNPVHTDRLYYELSLPVNTGNFKIEVFNTNGKLLVSKPVKDISGSVYLPKVSGVLIIKVMMDDKPLSSHQILVVND